jgi:predicted Zn-dependent protease
MRLAGDLEGGLLAVEQCLADAPGDASAHNVRGLLLDQMGQPAAAEAAFRVAADLAPTSAVYRGNLGATLAERGRHDEAVAALRLAASLDPNLPYVHMELGDVFRRKGDEPSARKEYERARHLLDAAMAERPFDLGAWRRLVRLYQSLGRYREADEARKVVAELEAGALYEGDPSAVVAGRDRAAPVAPPRVR